MKLQNLLQWCKKNDKLAHFIIITCLTIICYCVLKFYAIFVIIIVSVGKEIYDIYKPNPTGFDVKDILYDTLGFITGITIHYIIITWLV